MSSFSAAVLLAATALTLGLIMYVVVWLPRALAERSLQTMRAFSTAIELRFENHQGLTAQMEVVVQRIATALKMTSRQKQELLMATHLRDIGLCAIPYDLVNVRPHHDWTVAERATYDRHAEVSGAMLELVPSLRHLSPIAQFHHMRHEDFPKLMDGHEVSPPLAAEILNVASAFVWTSTKEGVSAAKARLEAGAGTIFAPLVVEAALSVITSERVEPSVERAAV